MLVPVDLFKKLQMLQNLLCFLKVRPLFAFHGADQNTVHEFKLHQIVFPAGFSFVDRFNTLMQKILTDDILQHSGMFFLVINPADKLVIVGFSFTAQGLDFPHRFFNGFHMLADHGKTQGIPVNAAGNFTVRM